MLDLIITEVVYIITFLKIQKQKTDRSDLRVREWVENGLLKLNYDILLCQKP